jgi:hypothetical protein
LVVPLHDGMVGEGHGFIRPKTPQNVPGFSH